MSAEDTQKELDARVKAFNEKFLPLLGEFKLGLAASAYITPDGRIAARPLLVDDSRTEEAKVEESEPVAPGTEKIEGETGVVEA